MKLKRIALLFWCLLGAEITVFQPVSHAADASKWDQTAHAAVRLVGVASKPGTETIRAGVEIKLQSGWKTYWRYPGDSGIPPRFDFEQSANVSGVQVDWPAPSTLKDPYGVAIGYKDHVVFPLRVSRVDPKKPAILRLRLNYAVCENICIPVDAKAELALPAAGGAHAALVEAHAARIPNALEIGADAPLAIKRVHKVSGGAKPVIEVEVSAPAGDHVELFAEGPNSSWALPLPEPVAGEPARFRFELDGAPSDTVFEGVVVRLTAVTKDRAIETEVRLD